MYHHVILVAISSLLIVCNFLKFAILASLVAFSTLYGSATVWIPLPPFASAVTFPYNIQVLSQPKSACISANACSFILLAGCSSSCFFQLSGVCQFSISDAGCSDTSFCGVETLGCFVPQFHFGVVGCVCGVVFHS